MTRTLQERDVIRLSNETLPHLPTPVARPRYDRAALRPGILHIGVGNFHRAHQAWYLHRLFEQGLDLDWAIIGAGVRPNDETMRQRLRAQDFLTTLIELNPEGSAAQVTGAMVDFLPVTPGHAALIDGMARPEIRIVSLTVTEGGYYIDPVTKGFAADHPDIRHDAAHPDRPRTAFGAMVAALRRRRAAGHGPFTGLSCDNLQGNGAVLRQAVVSLARMSDPDLADWIDRECSFPNSMVDCIVPATGERERALAAEFGIADAAPVTHEAFRQWVIEDDFRAGRPAWERVGVVFSRAVPDYEAMKLRLLNGGHQILANPGEVMGRATIAECMADPLISALFDRIARREIAPHVAPVPGMDPQTYLGVIQRRFANPRIIDTTRRVAFDGSSRHPGFVIPSIRDGLATGGPITGLALAEAAWARMCAGQREDGSAIAPNDPQWDRLQDAALRARDDPAAWLAQGHYDGDLCRNARFVAAFDHWLRLIWAEGMAAAIRAYLDAT